MRNQQSVKLLALLSKREFWLTDDLIKILGIYFSYNKKLEQEKNFSNHAVKIQKILKLWKLRNLTIERKFLKKNH